MSWYAAATVNNTPDQHYIYINNSAEEQNALNGYSAALFGGYKYVDVVLVGGGGSGGIGGSGGQGLAGSGGGSGNRYGYLNTKYLDTNTNYLYDYSIAPAATITITLNSYVFDTIKVTLGAGSTPSNVSYQAGTTTFELISSGSTVYSVTASGAFNGVFSDTAGSGFNGGGAGRRSGEVYSPGSGDLVNGGQDGVGQVGGGIGAGTLNPGYSAGSGAGGSGVAITLNGNPVVTGGSATNGVGGSGMNYTGAGGAGGQYGDFQSGNGGKGYAILYFHN